MKWQKLKKKLNTKKKNNDFKDLEELKDYYNNMLNIYLKFLEDKLK